MPAPAASTPAPGAASGQVRLERGALNDTTLAAVLTQVARHPPFLQYSFGLMVHNLTEQLRHGANVMAIEQGRLVAYAGWIRVKGAEAAAWQHGLRDLPEADWNGGDSAIITVTVTDNPAVLLPLFRAVSHVSAGVRVYCMRSFQDGRPDMRRPGIVGRPQVFK